MAHVIRTDDFERALKKLTRRMQALCDRQLSLLATDPRDPRLHIKKLRDLKGIFSFRVTRNYRGFFYFTENSIIVFDIDNRKDAYR